MSDGPVFVEKIDKAAIRSQLVKLVVLAEDADPLADDWDYWTNLIIDAALVGVREARRVAGYERQRRFVTEWEEVEE